MSVILILILASLGVALLFLGGFVWAVRSGQFEDTCTPAMRILATGDSIANVEIEELKTEKSKTGELETEK